LLCIKTSGITDNDDDDDDNNNNNTKAEHKDRE
jgi:hypothetical protein